MEKDVIQIVSNSYRETFRWGEHLADILREGDVVALYGELGTGKTVFTQGVCAGLDVDGYVTSPTFTLIQEYQGRLPVFHFDFYRLQTAREIEALDIDGYLSGGGVCIVEWAERGDALLPADRFSITLNHSISSETIDVKKRRLRFCGPRGRGLMDLII